MDTLPMSLDTLGGPDALAEFRISSPREVLILLKRLHDGNQLVNLNSSRGAVITTTIWTLDTDRGTIGFNADADDPRTQALLEDDEAVVVCYLDSVKLQFDVQGLVLVRGTRSSTLNGPLPRQMFRFQRRNAFRVRPLMSSSPTARMRHPAIADMALELRVLDVSVGGCALLLPDDVPPMAPGVLMNQVQIDLDADTRFHANLMLHHITSINPDSKGVRLGCEFVNCSADMQRSMQRFIDQTQKRRRLLSLD
jgi:c-di-GMP-binding flagellar brake protein YcgR